MAIATLGNFPFDMSIVEDFGLDGFGLFSEDDPVIDVITLSEVVVRDPVTGATIALEGSFNPFDLESSTITRAELRSGTGELVLLIENTNANLGDLFPEEGDPILSKAFNQNDTVIGSAANETLTGFEGDDLIQGNGGDDTLLFGPGNDTLGGGPGLDTAVANAPIGNFAVSVVPGGVLLTDLVGPFGTELIAPDVERGLFFDAVFARDLGRGGHAGDALALWGAGFGAVAPGSEIGRWIAEFDAGLSMAQVGQKMIDFFAPGVPNALLVEVLYTNVVGPPTPADQSILDFYVNQLDTQQQTQGEVFALAADLDLSRDQYVTVVGDVLQYQPFALPV